VAARHDPMWGKTACRGLQMTDFHGLVRLHPRVQPRRSEVGTFSLSVRLRTDCPSPMLSKTGRIRRRSKNLEVS